MKVTVICGSPRDESYTKVLTDIAFDYAKKIGHEVKYIDLRKDGVAQFKGLDIVYDSKTKRVVEAMGKTEVFVIGSPVYDGCMSSALKNLFELVDYKVLEGAVAGLIVKGGSRISFLQVQGQIQAMLDYFKVVSNPRAVFVDDADFKGDSLELKEPKIKGRIERLIDETTGLRGLGRQN